MNDIDKIASNLGSDILPYEFSYWVMWVFISITIINDHCFKYLWPGSITGRLSDISGVVIFIFILNYLFRLPMAISSWVCKVKKKKKGGISTFIAALLATYTIFILINVSSSASIFVENIIHEVLGIFILAPVRLWPDPLDLLTILLSLPIAILIFRKVSDQFLICNSYVSSSKKTISKLGIITASLASIATSVNGPIINGHVIEKVGEGEYYIPIELVDTGEGFSNYQGIFHDGNPISAGRSGSTLSKPFYRSTRVETKSNNSIIVVLERETSENEQ